MDIIEGFDPIEAHVGKNVGSSPWDRAVVAMGNFDGVHLGHQEILKNARRTAQEISGTSICFTFRPHPLKVLHPEYAPKMVQTFTQKSQAIEKMGIQILLVQKFDVPFSHLKYDEFFERFILKGLKPYGLRVGYNFAFGYQRKGNVNHLEKMCVNHGIDFHAIREVSVRQDSSNGEIQEEPLKISSSHLRRHLKNGEMKIAHQMLGRSYSIIGKVIHGEGRGNQVGFATANLAVENDRLIPRGVYACRVQLSDKTWNAVANLGIRPTFSKENSLTESEILEVHLLHFKGEIYGKTMEVSFEDFLRPEKKFSDAKALRKQIGLDIQQAEKIFQKIP